ncbi:shikimate dehydrogenase family protein [Wenyingzhuangia marina]|uniref:Shikimate dehydrogenase n=1 Tax=Wenyingzhuangia marina TaxID=1195760 RepID=A0A1M5VVB3_9FLAO|nr:shikimate dehydrogenase [Wenyingzhuangia marina]GGF77803.1 shikimate 5-dehydrogenase [Wenyingzhuangia marina]SHH78873.1 shikimate dehydrogenase [Wenyingzhuangia marina]
MNKVTFGLVGKNISYSFSRGYFAEKFQKLGLENHQYVNFDLQEISLLEDIIKAKENGLKGLNVTIPYKQDVQPFLNSIDADAKEIGAVNTIKLNEDGTVVGYNTDVYGFQKSLEPLLKSHHTKALILGTGGASKAVAFAFKKLGIEYKFVSRTASENKWSYDDLNKEIIQEYTVIVNCSPLGTSPKVELKPEIPYQFLNSNHLLYDLIYNPAETTFLRMGKEQGAVIKNGLEMLELQAEKSWSIWNS